MIVFIIGIALLAFATHLDLASTFEAIKNPRIHEGNGLMKWAISRGKVVSYAFSFAINILGAVFCFAVKSWTGVSLSTCASILFIGAAAHLLAYRNNLKNIKKYSNR